MLHSIYPTRLSGPNILGVPSPVEQIVSILRQHDLETNFTPPRVVHAEGTIITGGTISHIALRQSCAIILDD